MYILEYNSTYLSSYLLPRYLVAMAALLLEILPIVLVDKKERERERERDRKKKDRRPNLHIPNRMLETFPLRVSYQLPPLTRDWYLLIRGIVECRNVECRKVEERRKEGRKRVLYRTLRVESCKVRLGSTCRPEG